MSRLPIALVLALTACSPAEGGERTIVASVYPLAFLAEAVAGPGWTVTDLTPPGVEAHDLELSLEHRTAIQNADLVLYVGDIGFQPQVEAAVQETEAAVFSMADALAVHGRSVPTARDPHVWLDLQTMAATAHTLATTLGSVVESERDEFGRRAEGVAARLSSLDEDFRERLADCRFDTAMVTHEAFGFLFDRYGLEQFGLSGTTPEAEPSADRLAEARELVASGAVGAVFYEEHEEARRLAESVAADLNLPTSPLYTLETRPQLHPDGGDYFTAMEDNLVFLQDGLRCR